MGALTLSLLTWRAAARRPPVLFAVLMVALSAGFLILPTPGADYATLTLGGHPIAYTPAVMGFIIGVEFSAFSGGLGVLAMTIVSPAAAWRSVYGLAAAPSWRLALGSWIAGFGVGVSLLACIWAGALLRGYPILAERGHVWSAVWTLSSWAYPLGMVGAAISATLYSLLSMRLATRPGAFMAVAFATWMASVIVMANAGLDLGGLQFGASQFFGLSRRAAFSIGVILGHHQLPLSPRPVGALAGAPGAGMFLLSRLLIVMGLLGLALAFAGPQLKPLARGPTRRGRPLGAAVSARFGAVGVLVRQVWRPSPWLGSATLVVLVIEALHAKDPLGSIALGFGWGLYMLRWPELFERLERGALGPLIHFSVMGAWRIRAYAVAVIAVQMAIVSAPLAIGYAVAGRMGGLGWLLLQEIGAPLVCAALGRVRGATTLTCLGLTVWWYLLVTGNLRPPVS